jgi:hypothetical protein
MSRWPDTESVMSAAHRISKEYREAVSDLLLECQYVEMLLAVYLLDAELVADSRMRPLGIRIISTSKDYVDKPMGALVKAFARRTSDRNLVGRLRKLNTLRNEAAHDALLWADIYAEKRDEVSGKLGVWRKAAREAYSLREILSEEHLRVVAHMADGQ